MTNKEILALIRRVPELCEKAPTAINERVGTYDQSLDKTFYQLHPDCVAFYDAARILFPIMFGMIQDQMELDSIKEREADDFDQYLDDWLVNVLQRLDVQRMLKLESSDD